MYLPLMAIVVLVVTGCGAAFQVRPRKPRDLAPRKGPPTPHRWAAMVSIAILAVLLSIATIQRNAEYLSGLTLWQSVLDRWPPHARAHRNLAAELKLAGRPDEEIAHLRAAVDGSPRDPEPARPRAAVPRQE